jgi:DNA-binding SARP family transcriptional activator
MLEIRLFGTGSAYFQQRPLDGFPGTLPYHLLCFLLLNRNLNHHRERLAAIFWGDYPTSTSRKRLRDSLWRLRHSLEAIGAPVDELLVIDEESVSFHAEDGYWLDIEEFENAINGYQDVSGDQLDARSARDLEAAADLYVGDLLEGIYEDWCLNDRERFNLYFVSALNKLMIYHGSVENYERAIIYGEKILAQDNTREKVHRQLMRLHWLSGERNMALAQYERCAQILRESLAIKPMPATRRLYESMRKNEFRPAPVEGVAIGSIDFLEAADPADHPLIEHALTRLRQLEEVLEQTRAELRRVERLISQGLAGRSRS